MPGAIFLGGALPAVEEEAVVEPRRFMSDSRDYDRARPGDTDAFALPGNGGRALTHSERRWLVDQMASRRGRPVDPARSGEAEPPRPPEAVPPASTPRRPATDESSDATNRKRTTVRPPAPAAAGSFWSFG